MHTILTVYYKFNQVNSELKMASTFLIKFYTVGIIINVDKCMIKTLGIKIEQKNQLV